MPRFFTWKKGPAPAETAAPLPNGWLAVETAEALLGTPERQRLIDLIWQYSAVSTAQFKRLYRQPLLRYAGLVQQLPASEYHHHAYLGGMLDHGLELMATALKLRQSHLLPASASPEDQAAQNDAWSAALAYGALLHDIGKLAVDIEVECFAGQPWHPWEGPLQSAYRFRYIAGREYKLHSAAVGLVHAHVLTPDLLNWLSGYPAPWRCLIFALAGQYDQADVLGEIITQADRISTAQNIGANPTKAMQAPVKSLQHHLLTALRHLAQNELKLNQPGATGWLTADALWLVSKAVADKLRAYLLSQSVDGVPSSNIALFDELQSHGLVEPTAEGKAIWKATITDRDWQHSFTLLRVKPSLIWEGETRPADYQGSVTLEASSEAPATPVVEASETVPPWDDESLSADDLPAPLQDLQSLVLPLLDESVEPQVHEELDHTPEPREKAEPPPSFVDWLKAGIASRELILNDSKAMVHMVDGCVFLVTPQLFQRYAKTHPNAAPGAPTSDKAWKTVQKQFEKLHLHRKQPDGTNIWTCQVRGPRKTSSLKGYLVEDVNLLVEAAPTDNSFLSLKPS